MYIYIYFIYQQFYFIINDTILQIVMSHIRKTCINNIYRYTMLSERAVLASQARQINIRQKIKLY